MGYGSYMGFGGFGTIDNQATVFGKNAQPFSGTTRHLTVSLLRAKNAVTVANRRVAMMEATASAAARAGDARRAAQARIAADAAAAAAADAYKAQYAIALALDVQKAKEAAVRTTTAVPSGGFSPKSLDVTSTAVGPTLVDTDKGVALITDQPSGLIPTDAGPASPVGAGVSVIDASTQGDFTAIGPEGSAPPTLDPAAQAALQAGMMQAFSFGPVSEWKIFGFTLKQIGIGAAAAAVGFYLWKRSKRSSSRAGSPRQMEAELVRNRRRNRRSR